MNLRALILVAAETTAVLVVRTGGRIKIAALWT
eukprot:COSAG02_NODE_1411_length_12757_cov_226.591642_8_plen_33_part_00